MARRIRELWRTLRVGDRVRIVEYPPEFQRPGYGIHRETVSVYKKLVARRRPLRVYKIDAWGLPWVHCRFLRKDGRWEYHSLAINHDGLALVKPRRRRKR